MKWTDKLKLKRVIKKTRQKINKTRKETNDVIKEKYLEEAKTVLISMEEIFDFPTPPNTEFNKEYLDTLKQEDILGLLQEVTEALEELKWIRSNG